MDKMANLIVEIGVDFGLDDAGVSSLRPSLATKRGVTALCGLADLSMDLS